MSGWKQGNKAYSRSSEGYGRPIVVLSGLTDRVPMHIKQKIISHRYVDMREVIELKKPASEESCRLSVQMGIDGTPTLVYLLAKKKALTLSEYSFGWCIYKAVYLSAFPTEALAMLTFENYICNLARQGFNWLRYDEEFRRGMELHGYHWGAMRPYLDKVIYTSLISTEASTSHSFYRPSQHRFRPHQQIFCTSQESFQPNFEGTERMSGNLESAFQKGTQDPDIPKGIATNSTLEGFAVSSMTNITMNNPALSVRRPIHSISVQKVNQNVVQTQNLLPTPVKFEALDRYLDGFSKRKKGIVTV